MSGRSCNRKPISKETVEKAVELFRAKLNRRLEEKGYGSFSSRHELIGIIDEEVMELKQVSHDDKNGFAEYQEELMDVGVASIFGVACIIENGLEW